MDNLKEKILKELLAEVELLGFYICGDALEDYDLDMKDKVERSYTVIDRFAMLLDYQGVSDYLRKTPEARAVFIREIKSGIVRHWDMGLDYEEFYDDLMDVIENQYIELTPEEAADIEQCIIERSAS